jgi:hypothetical protein
MSCNHAQPSDVATKQVEQEQAARSLAEKKFSDLAARVCPYLFVLVILDS